MSEKAQHHEARRDNGNSRRTKREFVYIDTPTFALSSNGIKCIYHLAVQLVNIGVNVRFLPRDIRAFRQMVPSEFEGIKIVMPWQVERPATLICLESVPAKTIKIARRKGLRIFWWYLAPHGLLEKQKATPRPGEKLAVFSPYVFPEQNYYYFQPPLDNDWLNAIRKHRPRTDHKQVVIGVYCGKGLLKSLPEELRALMINADIRVISRTSPQTRFELFALLSSLDGLITFDEISQLTLESASVGIPIFIANQLFPRDSSLMFPLPIEEFATSDHNDFIVRVHKRRCNQTHRIPISSLYTQNHSTIKQILEDLECTNWEWTNATVERYRNIVEFGQGLNKKNRIAPYYAGQSAGTYLLRLYLLSLAYSRNWHHSVCMLISLVDQIGRFSYVIGFAKVFEIIVTRTKSSKSARAGARWVNKFRA